MRILQMVPRLHVGGVETGTVDLAKALQAHGHTAYVMSAGGALVRELEKAGIKHYTLPVHKKSLRALWLVHTVRQIIERERIEIVHARSRVPGWIAYLATRQTKATFITTCHGYYSTHFFSRVMGWGKKVIVISQAIGRHMIEHFGVAPERLALIYRGIDTTRFRPSPDKYLRSHAALYRVINIGRLSPIKGHEDFICAVHLLTKDIPRLEVSIVGEPEAGKEEYLDELKTLVRRLRLEETITFLGTRRDIPQLLAQSHLLVLSTRVPEAFGRVIAEAGASGTAVVATNVGGVSEIVSDGQEGLLVPPRDVEAMAAAMRRLLTNPEQARCMALQLHTKVRQVFDLPTMLERTLAVYEAARKEQRIVITKFGAFGDVILAVPSFRKIRERFPQAHITVLTDPQFIDILTPCPYVDEVMPFARRQLRSVRGFLTLVRRLRRRHFDCAIDLQNSNRTHCLAALAGIPRRYGFRRKAFGWLLTHGVREPEGVVAPLAHQGKLLAQFGVQSMDGESLELWPRPEDTARVHQLLSTEWTGGTQRCIGFVLGASPQWHTKCWPIEYYATLGAQLAHSFNARLILIGNAHDAPLAREFLARHKEGVINLIGRTSPAELVALIKRLDLLIGGDTAPLHIAAAVGTPIISFFGPTDPARHAPPAAHHIILRKELPCAPCYQGRCFIGHLCMKEITVNEVFQAADKQLHSREHLATV